jgi:hypothetical protein
MKDEIQKYFDSLIANYDDWQENTVQLGGAEIAARMIASFKANSRIDFGSKYAKIVLNNSAHSFVVLTDNDKKFNKGDILKSASWAAPARNFSRGNVFNDVLPNRWLGI